MLPSNLFEWFFYFTDVAIGTYGFIKWLRFKIYRYKHRNHHIKYADFDVQKMIEEKHSYEYDWKAEYAKLMEKNDYNL